MEKLESSDDSETTDPRVLLRPEPSWPDALSWQTLGDRIRLQVGGYLLHDFAEIDQDDNLDMLGEIGEDHSEVRTLQFDVRGRLFRDIQYRLQLNVDGGSVELADNYFQRDNLPYLGSLQFGHFKEPFGLENSSSIRYIPFMERSLANALSPSRGLGLAASNVAFHDRLHWKLGAFYETDSVDNISDSRSFAITGRLTGLPLYQNDGADVVHLGISVSHRLLNAPMNLRVRPEANLAPRYLETGDFAADSFTLTNLEVAYLHGPLLIQGEYTWGATQGAIREEDATLNDIVAEAASRLPRLTEYLRGDAHREHLTDGLLWTLPFDLDARRALQFFGVYGQASYVLTGEQRGYDVSRGVFGPVIPENPVRFDSSKGWGAWEIGARFSHIDFEDEYVSGGRQSNITLGINWYLNENVRVMWNYVHGKAKRDSFEGNFDIWQMRLQLDFRPSRVKEMQSREKSP